MADFSACLGNRAVGQIVAAANDFIAGNFHQLDRLGFARLEPHGGARRNVEALAISLGAVESQRRVGFDEMVMAADLNRPVAEIGHGECDGVAAGIQFQFAFQDDASAGFKVLFVGVGLEQGHVRHRQKTAVQRQRQIAIFRGNGMMHRDQLCAVGKCAFDLHLGDHGRHAGHDLVAAEQLAAQIHQFRHGSAVADEFEQLRGDQRHGFGMIQAQAARQSLLRQKPA